MYEGAGKTRHTVAVKFDHMVHDERFWPIMVTLLLFALLIGIALWAAYTGEPQVSPRQPMYPFTY